MPKSRLMLAGILLCCAPIHAGDVDCGGCTGDVNGDLTVDGADLGLLLSVWGRGSQCSDLNQDGITDGADLGLLLSSWGDCSCPVEAGLVVPEGDSPLTGIAELLIVAQSACGPWIPMQGATFEASQDGLVWRAIDTVLPLEAEGFSFLSGLASARWDTSDVESGPWQVRGAVILEDGTTVSTEVVDVDVAKVPTATAILAGVGPRGITLDGASSSSPNGPIVEWTWLFPSGDIIHGPLATIGLPDHATTLAFILTVTDAAGFSGDSLYAIDPGPPVVVKKEEGCVCKSIELRGDQADESKAAGPDGDDSDNDGWPDKGQPWSGKKLGKMGDDTENRVTNGEKAWTGVKFEILAEVTGDPKLCKEIQVRKSRWIYKGLTKEVCEKNDGAWDAAAMTCTKYGSWTGKSKDIDMDGMLNSPPDLDVGTKMKCEDAGGSWSNGNCTMTFPQDKAAYGPDVPKDSAKGGAYEEPWTYKKHVKGKVVTFDSPGFNNAADGSTYVSDFMFMIRGTDGTYCYVAFTVTLERKAGPDTEKIEQTGTAVGATTVPGINAP